MKITEGQLDSLVKLFLLEDTMSEEFDSLEEDDEISEDAGGVIQTIKFLTAKLKTVANPAAQSAIRNQIGSLSASLRGMA